MGIYLIQQSFYMREVEQIKTLVVPRSLVLFLDNNKILFPKNKFFFFDYPNQGKVLIVYNFLSKGVSVSKILPLFIVHYTNRYLHLFNKKYMFSGEFRGIYWHNYNQLLKTVLVASFGFCKIVQFVGFRFRQKWIRSRQALRLRAGYSKKVWLKCPNDFISYIKKHNPKKRTHFYFSFSRHLLKHIVTLMYTARAATIYKGRGINIKETPIEIKQGKKTIW